MRFACLAALALVIIPAQASAVDWTWEALIGVGPGYTFASRDENGAEEGIETYLDFGARATSHISFGVRDRQEAENRSIHRLSGWGRFDIVRYQDAEWIPYGKLCFGDILMDANGVTPDVANGLWSFIAGMEFKQSGIYSLFAEGEGVWDVQDGQINDIGLKMGALFRFGSGQP